jgi:hypothetical protein
MNWERDKAEEFLSLTGNQAFPESIHQDRVLGSREFQDSTTGNSVNFASPDSIPGISRDTISSQISGAVIQDSSDSLRIAASDADSITVEASDSIPVSPEQSVGIPVPLSDSTGTAISGGSLQESPREKTEIRELQTGNARNEIKTMAARPEIITSQSPLKTYYFDSSYYLDEVRDSLPYRKNIFPVPPEKTSDNAVYRPVFIQEDYSGVNQANGSYKVYLNSEINTISREAEYSAVWIPALLILSLLLLAWIKLIYVQFLTPVLISAFNYKESVKLFNGKNAPAQNAFLILNIIFVINGALFLLFVSGFFDLNLPDFKPGLLFIGFSVCLVLLYALKSFTLGILGFLFDQQKLISEYKYNISLYNKIFGLMLLPLIVGMLYGSEHLHVAIIYTGLAMWAAFYLLQLARGLEIIVSKDFSVFYLVLYLCAFEIFPIIVLYKLIELLFI